MLKHCFLGLLAVFGAALIAIPAADAESPVVGEWVTEGGKSRVRIVECGENLCGRVVWLREPNNEEGEPKRDINNPDAALRDRAILGLQILSGFTREDDGGTEWADGQIYNPEDGDTYRCTIRIQEDGSLRVRGYVGIPLLGQTQVWQRRQTAAEN